MQPEFKIIGSSELDAALRRVASSMEDASPAMRAVSLVLLRESERIFAQEGRGVGLDQEWAPLSEVTKHRRALMQSGGRQYGKNGKQLPRYTSAAGGLMNILQVSGKLASSVTPTSSAHSAGLTTNRRYAATMFFGARQGQFGRDQRNHPLPWGDIPGRVFFPLRDIHSGGARLTEPAERSVLEVLMQHFVP
jgi:phage gpG-like protein